MTGGHTSPRWVREKLAAMRAEMETLRPEAEERLTRLVDLLEARDYDAAHHEAGMLIEALRRLRRLSHDAARLERAAEGSET